MLALLLAARFRRPAPLLLGILVATFLDHVAAGAVGTWLAHVVGPRVIAGVIGIAFIGMAVWTLTPAPPRAPDAIRERFGVFGTALFAFLLAELGDRSELAVVALAARYENLLPVVAGTTLGMVLADIPAVILGHRMAATLPLRQAHAIGAMVFASVGVLMLLRVDRVF